MNAEKIWVINHKKVQVIMQKLGLKGKYKRRKYPCTKGKWIKLRTIKDLFNGEIIAYDLAESPNFEQITRMMKHAVTRLNGAKPDITFRPRLAISDDRFSAYLPTKWHEAKYVEKGKFLG